MINRLNDNRHHNEQLIKKNNIYYIPKEVDDANEEEDYDLNNLEIKNQDAILNLFKFIDTNGKEI